MQAVEECTSVVEAIRARKSVRAFRADPVSREQVRHVLELARCAPSWSNTQPWEVAVATDMRLATLKDALAAKYSATVPPNPDVPVATFPSLYHQRSRENGLSLYGVLGIRKEDVDKKLTFTQGMARFFDAPVGMVFYLDKALPPWSILDLGAFLQTVMLAAVGLGLATCPMAAPIFYPDVVREILGIPGTKNLYVGMGLGYENQDAPVNLHRSPRVPLDDFVSWCAD